MNLIYPNVLEKIGTWQTLVAYSSGDKCQQVCFNGLICVAMKSFISLVDVIKKRKKNKGGSGDLMRVYVFCSKVALFFGTLTWVVTSYFRHLVTF